MKNFIILFLLILTSCAHKVTPEPILIDSSQVIPFDEARNDISTAKSPALYRFEKSGRKLWYLAASHETNPDTDTFRFVDWIFENQKIDIAIVEGFETRLGKDPQSIRSVIFYGKTNSFYPNGEPSFVVEKSLERKIPFVGGEPSDADIYNAVLSKGYTVQDLIGFNFVRRMPQLIRSHEVKDMKSVKAQFDSYLKVKMRDFGIKELGFTFNDFKKWYKAKQGKEFSLEAGSRGETAPIEGPYFTQKISGIITTFRDEHILKTINELVNTYSNVFIVYGSSHYRVEHKALKAGLGEPEEIILIGPK